MWCSVSSYGAAVAAPTTSRPRSAASRLSSAAVMGGLCLVRAVRIHEDGGPEVLRLEELPDPEPGPGEVLVELRAAGLNHLDVWVRKGLPSVPKPRILGADGAGVVAALGEGVDGFAVGERVVLNPGIVPRRSDNGRRRAHGRHVLRAQGDSRRAALPAGRVALVRGRGGVPARLRDRVPDARDQGRAPRRESGC